MNFIKELASEFLKTDNLIKQNEIKSQAIEYLKSLNFQSIAQAKKTLGLSYLGSVNSSAKIVKNKKKNYDTYILYMSPASSSGFNTCPKASEGCIKACLNTSGRVKMDVKNTILISRLVKTWLFYSQRDFFNEWLFKEILTSNLRAKRIGHKFSVRINGTTDISPKLFKFNGKNVIEYFSNVQFYDYTKVYNRLNMSNEYKNYHLTFSYSEDNLNEVKQALVDGYNVAVPFAKELPNDFLGYKVGDADATDLRFLDTERIAGLKVKITRDKKAIEYAIKKGFVVQTK